MDREEAINLLRSGREGVAEWNRWRESDRSHPIPDLHAANLIKAHIRAADLSGVDLREAQLYAANLCEADLSDADLSMADLESAQLVGSNLSRAKLQRADLLRANLRGANLFAADFCGADLREATLCQAYLRKANLSWTDLRDADLSRAELIEADLRKANLILARFTGADLDKVNITGAQIAGCTWDATDLSEVMGLETIKHSGPSSIGVDTLYLSRGKIPEAFLRGCGVPQTLIAYLPSLIASMQPIQFYSCFISHSFNDKEFCRRLHDRMQGEGLRVWFDQEDMQGGRKVHQQIMEAIQVYDKLLIVLSEHAMASEWVKTEIYHARQRELAEKRTILFPIRLCSFDAIRNWQCFDADTGKDLAREIREYHIPGDFERWKDHDLFEKAFAKLMADLRAGGEE